MKKILVGTILGLTMTASVFGQGRVWLDTYTTGPYPQITYGFIPTPINSSFTIGVYWAPGNVVGSVAADTGGIGVNGALPTSLYAGFQLGTGTGSTVQAAVAAAPGYFTSVLDFTMTPLASGPVTLMIVAYNGSSYATSLLRGHSLPFVMTPAQFGTAPGVGAAMPGFNFYIPEPSSFALAGIGLTCLLVFRRRQ